MRLLARAALLAILLAPAARAQATAADPWGAELAAFAASDQAHPPSKGGVLFVGSSSIRLWESLATDFQGVPVLNRGFGGSQLGDVVRLADRVVIPYQPRLIVLYAGDNDLAAGRTPAQVTHDFRAFVGIVRRSLPGTRVVFVAIKPSLARVALMPQVRETNARIERIAHTDGTIRFVDVFTPMLDSLGRPRAELFREDGLHMTAAGYAIWRERLAGVVK